MIRSLIALAVIAQALPAAEVTAEINKNSVLFKSDGEIITEYRYAGEVKNEKGDGTKPLAKPFFWPLNAPGNTPVTRAWPMERGKPGESVDHFHQKSAWFCHGDVIPEGKSKGVDFWTENPGSGRIVCTSVEATAAPKGAAAVATVNEWRSKDGDVILEERRIITVRPFETGYLIEVDSTLIARDRPVTFGDTKEGSFGVRVPDNFQLTAKFGDGKGVIRTAVGESATGPAKDNLPIWGRTADWHDFSGQAGDKTAGISVFADPKNKTASAWHTRAYGLMAANPFGRDKSGFPALKGNTDLVKLKKGESLRLRYGLFPHVGDAVNGKVADAFMQFTK